MVNRPVTKLCRILRIALALMGFCGSSLGSLADARGDDESEMRAIGLYDRASDNIGNPKVLAETLAELDGLLAVSPRDSQLHFIRGWVLRVSMRPEEALRAYRRSAALDPRAPVTFYAIACILEEFGRDKLALAAFERVLKLSPDHAESAYQAGVLRYRAKHYNKAAKHLRLAASLEPGDFRIANSLVQVYVALRKNPELDEARDRLRQLRAESRDPELLRSGSYVFDQFELGKYHVLVLEAYDPWDLFTPIYEFAVTRNGERLGSVSLEATSYERQGDTPVVFCVEKDDAHVLQTKYAWDKSPTYNVMMAAAIDLISENF